MALKYLLFIYLDCKGKRYNVCIILESNDVELSTYLRIILSTGMYNYDTSRWFINV